MQSWDVRCVGEGVSVCVCEDARAGWCVLWCGLGRLWWLHAPRVCTCGCVRLVFNSIGEKGCTALAGALVHVPSLTTLGYVG